MLRETVNKELWGGHLIQIIPMMLARTGTPKPEFKADCESDKKEEW